MRWFTWRWMAEYAASKLAAAGTVYAGFLLIFGKFDLYKLSEIAQATIYWKFIYVYAIAYSVAVDAVLIKCKANDVKPWLSFLLHMIGGYIPFVILTGGDWAFSLVCAMFGVPCAIVFYAASRLFRRRWPYSGAAAILLLAGIIWLSSVNFTMTRQWTETRTSEGYRAEFAFFNGHKKIPIELEAGQTLAYDVEWQVFGGYGTYLDLGNASGERVNDERHNGARMAYRAERPSTVYIVISGDEAQGAVTIHWEITGGEDRP